MLFGLILVVLVLVCLIVWLNVFLLRGRGTSAAPEHRPAKSRGKAVQPDLDSDPEQQRSPQLEPMRAAAGPIAQGERTAEIGARAPRASTAEASATTQAAAPMHAAEPAPTDAVPDVEVVGSGSRHSDPPKLFQRHALPYERYAASVPLFDSESWHECFLRMTADDRVLGWIGFEDEVVGASDRPYDEAFLNVLRGYRRSVSKLQREVGLSDVLETSVVGAEGQIWFLTGTRDIWFALFVDRDADVHEIAQPFRAELLRIAQPAGGAE
ncbi:MAG: hypothetical protein K6T78_02640 [Alicyclobacillus sp.]|nr:hypothetical protein [Alicyclobacillus sp.]